MNKPPTPQSKEDVVEYVTEDKEDEIYSQLERKLDDKRLLNSSMLDKLGFEDIISKSDTDDVYNELINNIEQKLDNVEYIHYNPEEILDLLKN